MEISQKSLSKLPLSELITLFKDPSPEHGYENFFYQEIAYAIAQKGINGLSFLWDMRDKSNNYQLRALVFALGHNEQFKENKIDWLIPYLSHNDIGVVAETINSLCWHQALHLMDDIKSFIGHESPYVYGNALRFIAKLAPTSQDTYEYLLQALTHPHYIVREYAVDELGESTFIQAIPYLKNMVNDPHPHVQQAVETAIDMLTDKTEQIF